MKKTLLSVFASIFFAFCIAGCSDADFYSYQQISPSELALPLNIGIISQHAGMPDENLPFEPNAEMLMPVAEKPEMAPAGDFQPTPDDDDVTREPNQETDPERAPFQGQSDIQPNEENMEIDNQNNENATEEYDTENNAQETACPINLVGAWAGKGDSDNLVLVFHNDTEWTLWKRSYGKWKINSAGTYYIETEPLTLTIIDPKQNLERTDDIEIVDNELHIIDPTFNEPYMTYERTEYDQLPFSLDK